MSDETPIREILADHAVKLLRRVWDEGASVHTLVAQAEQTIRLARTELGDPPFAGGDGTQ